MTKVVTYAAIGALALGMATAAQAADEGHWYAGIQGGVAMPGGETFNDGDAGLNLQQELDGGWAGGLLGGYDFGNLRLEADMTRRYNDMDEIEVFNAGGLGFPLGESTAQGETTANSLMLNVLLDWDDMGDGKIEPFFGGGLGIAKLKYDDIAAGMNALVDDSDTVFAYQAIAGLRYAITEAVELALSYRYFKTEDATLQDALNNSFKADYDSHDLMMALVYRFGTEKKEVKQPVAVAPAPAPEPEPVVAAVEPAAGPEPVATPVVNMGPYIVYFDFDDDGLTEAAQDVLEDVTEAAKAKEDAKVHLSGHADRAGNEGYNEALADRRNTAVAGQLQRNGVAAERLVTEGHGERKRAVETNDGIAEQMNRRVEINLK